MYRRQNIIAVRLQLCCMLFRAQASTLSSVMDRADRLMPIACAVWISCRTCSSKAGAHCTMPSALEAGPQQQWPTELKHAAPAHTVPKCAVMRADLQKQLGCERVGEDAAKLVASKHHLRAIVRASKQFGQVDTGHAWPSHICGYARRMPPGRAGGCRTLYP